MEGTKEHFRKANALFDAIVFRLAGAELSHVLALRDTPSAKPDGSFVTEGDLRVESLVRDAIKEHIRDAVLISEESEPQEVVFANDTWVVVLDPIDGTENFTSGLPEWGISVACYFNGRHVASLLGAPELGRWLRTGEQVQRHRSRIRGLSSSLSKEQILQVGTGPEYRMIGCCVVNMLSVIRGSYLSFENPKGANSWDILAGLNLALEHGLAVTVNGVPYRGEYLPADARYRFRIVHTGNAAHFASE